MTQSSETTELVLPIIHFNGTSKETLARELNAAIDAADDAYHAVHKAFDALKRTAPNGRDYYVGAAGLLEAAAKQHEARLAKLDEAAAALAEVNKGLARQLEGVEQQGNQ